MATHSDILAWRIPWTEEPGRGRKESDTTEQLSTLYIICVVYTHTTRTNTHIASPLLMYNLPTLKFTYFKCAS